MTKSLQFEIYKTQADLAIKRNQFDEAAFSLSNAVKTVNNKQEKARIYFILGQIYQQKRERGIRTGELFKSLIRSSNL